VPADRRLFAKAVDPAQGPRHSPARSDDEQIELLKHHADADHGALIGKVSGESGCRLPEAHAAAADLDGARVQPSRWLIHRNSVLLPDPLGEQCNDFANAHRHVDAGEKGWLSYALYNR